MSSVHSPRVTLNEHLTRLHAQIFVGAQQLKEDLWNLDLGRLGYVYIKKSTSADTLGTIIGMAVQYCMSN